jgi:hypothetical protein
MTYDLEKLVTLYVLYHWKFGNTEEFYKRQYKMDIKNLRESYLREYENQFMPIKTCDATEIRDELSKMDDLNTETCTKYLKTRIFDQPAESMEKYIWFVEKLERMSDREVFQNFLSNFNISVPDEYLTDYQRLAIFVKAMYPDLFDKKDLDSKINQPFLLLEKMADEIDEYRKPYSIINDYYLKLTGSQIPQLDAETKVFDSYFIPLYHYLMRSSMDREEMAVVISLLLKNFAKVKQVHEILKQRKEEKFGASQPRKTDLKKYAQKKYEELKKIKLSPLDPIEKKVNRKSYLADLMNTIGRIKQLERNILNISSQYDFVDANTLKRWLRKSKSA